jgi:hypothetical protein
VVVLLSSFCRSSVVVLSFFCRSAVFLLFFHSFVLIHHFGRSLLIISSVVVKKKQSFKFYSSCYYCKLVVTYIPSSNYLNRFYCDKLTVTNSFV